MCDKQRLVSYVYDELQGEERKAFQHHLASCLECREEVQSLRGTRAHLVSWTAPEPDVSFTIQAEPRGSGTRRVRLASWPLATAAALVLAVGALVANVEVRVIDGGVTIRAGSSQTPVPAAVQPDDGNTREALVSVEQRIRELEAAIQAPPARNAASGAVQPVVHAQGDGRIDRDEVFRRVRQMIDESEGRQQQQVAVRLMQVVREMQAEHTLDLVRLEQTLNQQQAASSDEIVRQREEMRQFYRLVNQQR